MWELAEQVQPAVKLSTEIQRKREAVQAAGEELYRLRQAFAVQKQQITGRRSFSAKDVAGEPFVADLINAFKDHGQAARKLYIQAHDTYLGTTSLERSLVGHAKEVKEKAEQKRKWAAAVTYILAVFAGILGVLSSAIKARNGDLKIPR